MSESFRDKVRSINVSRPRNRTKKTTVDHHDYGTVEVTEHWDDRQDVNVKPDVAHVRGQVKEI